MRYETRETPPNTTSIKYTLEYPVAVLNRALYPVRGGSGGYRYMSTKGFTKDTTLTLMTHMFSTGSGSNITDCSILYSIEIIDQRGGFEYYDIESIDVIQIKIPRSGAKYNIFSLNKKYVISNTTKILDFSKYNMFSVYITQKLGTLSGDTSTLDLLIEV